MLQWRYWAVLGSGLGQQAEERCFKAQQLSKQMRCEGEPLFTFLSAHGLIKSNRCVRAPAYFLILCRSSLKGIFPVTNPLAQCGLLYPTFFQLMVG